MHPLHWVEIVTTFVLITFDLHTARPAQYKQIKMRLSKLKINKFVRSIKRSRRKLPANTYAAKYDGSWSEKRASELRDVLRQRLRNIIDDEGLEADILVVVAKQWAWGTAHI